MKYFKHEKGRRGLPSAPGLKLFGERLTPSSINRESAGVKNGRIDYENWADPKTWQGPEPHQRVMRFTVDDGAIYARYLCQTHGRALSEGCLWWGEDGNELTCEALFGRPLIGDCRECLRIGRKAPFGIPGFDLVYDGSPAVLDERAYTPAQHHKACTLLESLAALGIPVIEETLDEYRWQDLYRQALKYRPRARKAVRRYQWHSSEGVLLKETIQ
jgi:hypothetical protein